MARQHQHRPRNTHQGSGKTAKLAFYLPKLHLGVQGKKKISRREKIGCTLTFRLHWFLLQSYGKNHILHFPGKPSPSLSKQAAFLLLFLPKPSSVHRSASTHTQGINQGRLCSPVSHPGSSALLQNEAYVQTST